MTQQRAESERRPRDAAVTILGALLAAVVVFGAVFLIRERGLLFTAEARTLDAMLLMRARGITEENPCVIVRISERDIRDLMRQYPISDDMLAALLERIASFSPKAIGVDLFRDVAVPSTPSPIEPGKAPAFASTQPSRPLPEVLKQIRTIVGIYFIDEGEDWVGPPPALRGTPRAGFNNIPDDADGRVRRAPLYRDDPKSLMSREPVAEGTIAESQESFGLILTQRYLNDRVKGVDGMDGVFQLGEAQIRAISPTSGAYVAAQGAHQPAGYELLMDLQLHWPMEEHDLTDVFATSFDGSRLRDKIVMVGVRTTSIKDYLPTALDTYTPGVALQAMVAQQLIRAARTGVVGISSWRDSIETTWLALCCFVGGGIALALRSIAARKAQFAAVVGGGFVIVGWAALAATAWFFLKSNVWIPLVPPAIGLAASAALAIAWVTGRESAERQAWASLTGKLVSPAIATALWQSRRELFEAGRIRPRQTTATVLFLDLQGFTSISERIPAAEMIGLLNELFQEMTSSIEEHRGVVNKYVGDQIMALFGPPLPRETDAEFAEDAQNAVRCAIELRERLVEINRVWSQLDRPLLRMRVGIYTGPLVAGSVGSRDRLEYTVIGDTVNIASRLESASKEIGGEELAPGGCRIFIGGPTRDRLGGEFSLVEVPMTEIRGRKENVAVFAVLGYAQSSTKTQP